MATRKKHNAGTKAETLPTPQPDLKPDPVKPTPDKADRTGAVLVKLVKMLDEVLPGNDFESVLEN